MPTGQTAISNRANRPASTTSTSSFRMDQRETNEGRRTGPPAFRMNHSQDRRASNARSGSRRPNLSK
jgi:hypothetical protein